MGGGLGVDMVHLQLQWNVDYYDRATAFRLLDARAPSKGCRTLRDGARYKGGRELPRCHVVGYP